MANVLTALLLAATAALAYAQDSKPAFVKKYESEGVPAESRKTQFDSQTGVPLPKEATQTTQAESTLLVRAQPPTQEEKKAFAVALAALEKSPELTAKLGKESRLLSGGELPKSRYGNAAPQYKFTYYNYKKDQAIEAYVASGKVLKVKERELGYQPSVSQAELVEAAKIMSDNGVKAPAPETLRALAEAGPKGSREIRVFTSDDPAKSAVVNLYNKSVVIQ
jgi:hypothetical protein